MPDIYIFGLLVKDGVGISKKETRKFTLEFLLVRNKDPLLFKAKTHNFILKYLTICF